MDSAEVMDSTVVDSADEGAGGVWEATMVVLEPGPEGPAEPVGLTPVSEGEEGLPPLGPVGVAWPGTVCAEVVLICVEWVWVYLVVVLEADEQSKETVGMEIPQVEEAEGMLLPDWPVG